MKNLGGGQLGPDVDLIVMTDSADGHEVMFKLIPLSVEYAFLSPCWNFTTVPPSNNNTLYIYGTSNCVYNGWDYRRFVDDTETDITECNQVTAYQLPQAKHREYCAYEKNVTTKIN